MNAILNDNVGRDAVPDDMQQTREKTYQNSGVHPGPNGMGGEFMKTGKIQVLYVDDEPDLLDICRMFLEVSGDFSVGTIDSAPGALELLQTRQFDAIISDYQMPVMDGIRFLTEVRTNFGKIPFILFTGRGREEVVIEAINNGVDFYLQKGGEPDAQFAELSHKIKQAISRKQAEEALRESEERFSNAFEYAAIGMALVSPGGRWLRVNQSLCEIVGYSEKELQAMTFQDITHPDDLGTDIEYVRQMVAGEIGSYQMEKRYFHKSGQLVWALLSVSLVRDNQGRPRYFISQIENITDRKVAEEALKKSEEDYRRLVELSSEGIWLLDKNFITVYVNPAIEKMLGYSKDEMKGRFWYDFGDPGWVGRAKELGKRRQNGIGEPHEFLFLHKDGRRILARISTTPLFNNGHFDGALGILSDITWLKQAEETIRESRERYRMLFDTMTQGVVYQDREGRIIDANPAAMRIIGLPLDRMMTRSSANPGWEAVHEDGSYFPIENHPVMIALETGKEVRDIIMGIRNPDKEERIWVRINAVPQFRPGEEMPYQVFTTFDDISGTAGPSGAACKNSHMDRNSA